MLTENQNSAKFPECPVCYIRHWPHCKSWQRKQNLFLWLCVALVVAVLFALPAKAQEPSDAVPTIPTKITPHIEAGPVEIVDTNGVGVPNSTFYVYCDPSDYELFISIEAHFTGGGVTLLTEQYCGTKIFIEGYVSLAEIVAVMAEPPSVVYRVWLPAVVR
jgi:hypothetical protein